MQLKRDQTLQLQVLCWIKAFKNLVKLICTRNQDWISDRDKKIWSIENFHFCFCLLFQLATAEFGRKTMHSNT